MGLLEPGEERVAEVGVTDEGQHLAVLEVTVIGVPDAIKTEAIRAFVMLRPGHAASPDLAEQIRDSVRTRLARHECPRDVVFVEALPLTATGKIMRRELRKLAV